MKKDHRYQEIQTITDAICDGRATIEQIQRLEQLLEGDLNAQYFYADYVDMHIRLLSAADSHFEYVYRKTTREQTEEFVVRPVRNETMVSQALENHEQTSINFDADQPASPQTISSATRANGMPSVSSSRKMKSKKAIGLILCCLSVLLVAFLLSSPISQQSTGHHYIAQIISGHFDIVDRGQIDSDQIAAGEYYVNQDAELRLTNGDSIILSAQSTIILFNNNEVELEQGRMSLYSSGHNNVVVRGPSFRLYSNNGDLSLDLTQPQPIVTSGEHTILLPNKWRPKHYWSFESTSDRAVDSAGNAHGLISEGATKSSGLLGQGAFYFNNTEHARIDVGSGGGTALATGSFSVTEGVTIEALIKPKYSSISGDIDEIFRKDQDDKELRMLLALQNDQGKTYLKPEGEFKESISFGLYLVGQGYHELKLPLDGQNGRPTLAQLNSDKAHHISATYHVASGLKAIYIDGVMLAHYQYPAGSKMLSGGAGTTNIGNSPVHPNPNMIYDNAAFSGIIDEVAFYDFALPPQTIKLHFEYVQQGYNYYGLTPSDAPLPEQIKISLPRNSVFALSESSGLPYQLNVPHYTADNL